MLRQIGITRNAREHNRPKQIFINICAKKFLFSLFLYIGVTLKFTGGFKIQDLVPPLIKCLLFSDI